jgi:mersacidin/lichenicidin family type 2 lantibiotic
MKKELIVRAWKDPEFRARLTDRERAALPESPSGRSLTELDESELLEISGGRLAPRDLLPTGEAFTLNSPFCIKMETCQKRCDFNPTSVTPLLC